MTDQALSPERIDELAWHYDLYPEASSPRAEDIDAFAHACIAEATTSLTAERDALRAQLAAARGDALRLDAMAQNAWDAVWWESLQGERGHRISKYDERTGLLEQFAFAPNLRDALDQARHRLAVAAALAQPTNQTKPEEA